MAFKNNEDRTEVLNELDSVKTLLQALYKDVENAKAELESVKAKHDELSFTESQLEKARADLDKMEESLAKMEEKKDAIEDLSAKLEVEYEKSLKEFNQESVMMIDDLASINLDINESKDELNKMKKTLEMTTSQIADLTNEKLKAEDNVAKLKGEINKLEAVKLELVESNKRTSSERDNLLVHALELKEMIKCGEKELQDIKSSSEELRNSKEDLIRGIEEEVSLKKLEINTRQVALDEREEALIKKGAELSLREAALRDTVEKIQKYKAAIEKKTGVSTPPLDLN